MNLGHHFTNGEGKEVEDRREPRLSFGGAVDRVVVYCMAGLIAWLCLNTLAMREQIAVLVERGTHDKQRIEQIEAEQNSLRVNDKLIVQELQVLREQQIRHGWHTQTTAR